MSKVGYALYMFLTFNIASIYIRSSLQQSGSTREASDIALEFHRHTTSPSKPRRHAIDTRLASLDNTVAPSREPRRSSTTGIFACVKASGHGTNP